MASVVVRESAARVRALVRYREGDRQRDASVGALDLTGLAPVEAKRLRAELLATAAVRRAEIELRLRQGLLGVEPKPEPKPAAPRFEAVAERWIKQREAARDDDGMPRYRNGAADGRSVRLHLIPAFRRRTLAEIDAATVKAWLRSPALAKLSGASRRKLLMLLSRIANDNGAANPVRALDKATRSTYARPSRVDDDTPWLRPADMARVFNKLPDGPMRPLFALGALAGLRPSEALALQWADVDFERGQIRVERQKSDGGRPGAPATRPPKSRKPRFASLSGELARVLREWQAKADQRLLPGWCFPSCTGTLLHLRSLEQAFATARDSLPDLPRNRRTDEPLTLYEGTRHTFASNFVLEGGSLEHLAALLGHSSTLVAQRYAHLASHDAVDRNRNRVAVDLAAPEGRVLALREARQRPFRAAVGGQR